MTNSTEILDISENRVELKFDPVPSIEHAAATTFLPPRETQDRDGPAKLAIGRFVMAWIALLFAGLCEILWAAAMKQSAGFTRLWPSLITIVGMGVSVALLGWAMKTLPLGTAYMIWTGIGAVGAFLIGITLFGETLSRCDALPPCSLSQGSLS
ncbi:DMT family transporter [Asaia astilbis]|uniref:DMT family transporter n=1 Tax=Asaia astilbis TaxID=610244 RepID=UPI00277D1262|nr:multidrug efflux SMR transporter [Asaia astilbis]